VLSFELKMGSIGKLGKGKNAQVFSQMRKKINQKCRFSHQTRKFLLKTFENIRKRLKIFENVQKLYRNIRKYSKIFDFFETPLRK